MNEIANVRAAQIIPAEDGNYHFPKEATVIQIIEAMPSASEREVIDSLKILFASMPTRDQGDFELQASTMGYLMALDAAPLFAVQGAIKAFIRGEVKDQNKTFRPSPAMFAQEVRRQIFLKVRREQDKPSAIDPCEPIDWEARKKRVEQVKSLITSSSENSSRPHVNRDNFKKVADEARARLEERKRQLESNGGQP